MSLLYDWGSTVVRKVYDRRISGPPVLDSARHFPDAAQFIAAWHDIRDEAQRVACDLGNVPRFHEVMPAQEEISAQDAKDWRILILKAYGAPIQKNLVKCPHLAAVVSRCPDVLSASLFFLAPHKHIPPHRGPFRGVIRFQLGLIVPKDEFGRPAAVLKLHGQEYRVGDGESLLWDDTYVHEVNNRSGEVRAALLLDVRRHGMPWDLEILSRILIAGVRASVVLSR